MTIPKSADLTTFAIPATAGETGAIYSIATIAAILKIN
jgi:hypothetical protein